MDEYTRELMQEAFRIDDAARADAEQRERQQEQAREVVYKTVINEPPAAQVAPAMDAETEKRWNEWCDSRIRAVMDKLTPALGAATGKLIRAEVKKLRTEVDQLRAELKVVTSIQNGEIASIKGKSDAA